MPGVTTGSHSDLNPRSEQGDSVAEAWGCIPTGFSAHAEPAPPWWPFSQCTATYVKASAVDHRGPIGQHRHTPTPRGWVRVRLRWDAGVSELQKPLYP